MAAATVPTRLDPWPPARQDRPAPSPVPRTFTTPIRPVRPPVRTHRPRHSGLAAVTTVVLLLAGVFGFHRWQQDRPFTLRFDAAIEASSGRCASDEPLARQDVLTGFDVTCVMTDASPGNRDRPYVQVRIGGCDDWQRLDHDDSTEPVVITTGLAPCNSEPATLEWQVCQTHGGPLPDDCHNGSTDLPQR